MTQSSYPNQTSLSLFQVIHILARRKWWILITVLVFMLAAYLLAMQAPEKYTLRTVLEVGKYQSGQQADLNGLVLSGSLDFKTIEGGHETRSRYQAHALALHREPEFEELELKVEKDFDVELLSHTMVSPYLITRKSDQAITFMERLNDMVLRDQERLFAGLPGARPNKNRIPGKIEKNPMNLLTNEKNLGTHVNNTRTNPRQSWVDSEPPADIRLSRIVVSPFFEKEIVSPRPLRGTVLAGVIGFLLSVVGCFLVEGVGAYKQWTGHAKNEGGEE
jgi:hypothetical protein